MKAKIKYKVGQKVLYQIPGEDVRVGILRSLIGYAEKTELDFAISDTYIYSDEILRVISDKPLCKYGKLIPGAV